MTASNPIVRVRNADLPDAEARLPRSALAYFPRWHEVDADGAPVEHVDADELRGEALDAALDERDLPKTGTADEKRARVAEHDDELAQA